MARKLKAQGAAKNRASAPTGDQPDAAPKPAGGNVTLETKRDCALRCKAKLMEYEKLQAEAKKAQASYRAELKASRAMGVEPADITWGLAILKRDVEDVNREIRGRNEMARALGIPISEQLGLFADGETVATKVDQDKIAAGGEIDAEEAGYQAARAGKTMAANPYDFTSDAENFDKFEKGWGRGVAANVTGTPDGVVQPLSH